MSGFRAAVPGEYIDLGTPVHRAPVLLKAFAAIGLIVAASLTGGFAWLGAFSAMALTSAAAARLPRASWRAILAALLAFAVLSAAATLLLGGADGAWLPHTVDAALARVVATARAVLRAAVALLVVATFAFTTAPESLVEALARLRPSRRAPSGGFALAVLLALRLAPLLAEEYLRLRRARAARGAGFDAPAYRARGVSRRGRMLPDGIRAGDWSDLYLAYLGALMRRVDELSLALEARGYRG